MAQADIIFWPVQDFDIQSLLNAMHALKTKFGLNLFYREQKCRDSTSLERQKKQALGEDKGHTLIEMFMARISGISNL